MRAVADLVLVRPMRALTIVLMFAGFSLLGGCAVHPYSGIVVDARGRPVANAHVRGWHYAHTFERDVVNHRSEYLMVTGTTDAAGRFALWTHIRLDKIDVSGLYDNEGQPHGGKDLEKPKFTDNRIVLVDNVIYPARKHSRRP